ncbi:hypothetical protein [Microbacterium sp. LWO13-1.2]|uniref:hypothetical protein n=1 Tax=Microbacterium sp. LWO13-1.2 TaxID=3135262 RepID=UPI00313A2D37
MRRAAAGTIALLMAVGLTGCFPSTRAPSAAASTSAPTSEVSTPSRTEVDWKNYSS